MEKLTKQQEKILDFIKKFIATKKYPPSIREIGDELNLTSSATIHVHLTNLIKKGYIKKNSGKYRSLELMVDNEYIEIDQDIVKVPLLGKITAGNPIEAIEQPDNFFPLPINLIPHNTEVFTLNVSGESMIEAGIYDNDIVIIKKSNIAKNGDIVVAMTDENTVTLKTFYKEIDHFRLQPENKTMNPIILQNVSILGIAIGLYRKLWFSEEFKIFNKII